MLSRGMDTGQTPQGNTSKPPLSGSKVENGGRMHAERLVNDLVQESPTVRRFSTCRYECGGRVRDCMTWFCQLTSFGRRSCATTSVAGQQEARTLQTLPHYILKAADVPGHQPGGDFQTFVGRTHERKGNHTPVLL